jgi:hypothetical protein
MAGHAAIEDVAQLEEAHREHPFEQLENCSGRRGAKANSTIAPIAKMLTAPSRRRGL